jgi:hypothetical protein
MSEDRKPTPSEKHRMTAEPQAHCPMELQMDRGSSTEANENDDVKMSTAATLHSSSSPIGMVEDDATMELRKRNAVYSKRKYYKKKMEVERLEMSKSELGVANQRLRTENEILERALQEAQAKVLAVESLRGVAAGGSLLGHQQTASLPLINQQLSSAFRTSSLAVPTLSLPSNPSSLSEELAAAGGARGDNNTAGMSRDPSWQFNPVGLMNAERTLSLEERIRIAQARLQATQEEERQLLQLLSRIEGSIPPQVQQLQQPSLFQNLSQSMAPWSPRLPLDSPLLQAELQRSFLQGQSLPYQQQQNQQPRQLNQQTLALLEQHEQQQRRSEPLNLKSVGDGNSTDSASSVAI